MDKKTVLVVDDDKTYREMLAYALEEVFHVLTAENGREGVALALARLPDLIMMDAMMPVMSGLEALRLLQQDERTARIPVLICTGSVFDPGMRGMFHIEPNCAGFFSKTAPLDFLVGTVERTLAQQKG
jgi:CheY-like chemotaxis protein